MMACGDYLYRELAMMGGEEESLAGRDDAVDAVDGGERRREAAEAVNSVRDKTGARV